MPPVSLVLLIPAALTPVANKFATAGNVTIRGLRETDPCRKPEVENFVTLSF